MIKKLNKRLFLIVSVIVSSVLGFMYNDNRDNSLASVLKEPIFSVEKAYADGAGGDCCCGCEVVPPPTSAWVYIDFIEQ